MKMCALSFAIALAMTVLANTPAPRTRPISAMDPAKRAAFEKAQGGVVIPKDNGNRLMVWDASGKSGETVAAFTNMVDRLWHLPAVVKTDTIDGGLYKQAKGVKSSKFPCVIVLGEAGAELPALSVYPEEAIACINRSALAGADEDVYRKRIQKELYRAFGFTCGGYAINRTACVMDIALSIEDLDANHAVLLAPMRYSGINRAAARLGLPVLRATTYQQAVRQGWAPPPTNDLQKAIWEKNKDLPSLMPGMNPLQPRPKND